MRFIRSATPFNTKTQQQLMKFNTHTPTNMHFTTSPLQQHPLPNEQWSGPTTSTISSNHIPMQTQHQQSRAINTMQGMPLQHQQSRAINTMQGMPLQHQQPINNK